MLPRQFFRGGGAQPLCGGAVHVATGPFKSKQGIFTGRSRLRRRSSVRWTAQAKRQWTVIASAGIKCGCDPGDEQKEKEEASNGSTGATTARSLFIGNRHRLFLRGCGLSARR